MEYSLICFYLKMYLTLCLGYCAIDYAESATTTPDPFNLGPAAASANVSFYHFIIV
jgi:hypothetical protein